MRKILVILLMGCFWTTLSYADEQKSSEGKTQKAVALLKSHIDTFTITLGLSPAAHGQTDKNPGLRTVLLYTSEHLRLEPDGVWPNEKKVSSSAHIAAGEALQIIDWLAEQNFFKTADKFYSERTATDPNIFPPPENATDYLKNSRTKPPPYYSIQINISDEHWGTTFEALFDWEDKRLETLKAVRKILKGEAGAAMDNLIKEAEIVH